MAALELRTLFKNQFYFSFSEIVRTWLCVWSIIHSFKGCVTLRGQLFSFEMYNWRIHITEYETEIMNGMQIHRKEKKKRKKVKLK